MTWQTTSMSFFLFHSNPMYVHSLYVSFESLYFLSIFLNCCWYHQCHIDDKMILRFSSQIIRWFTICCNFLCTFFPETFCCHSTEFRIREQRQKIYSIPITIIQRCCIDCDCGCVLLLHFLRYDLDITHRYCLLRIICNTNYTIQKKEKK